MVFPQRNEEAQLRAVIRACGGSRSVVGASPAAAAWLVSPPYASLPTSVDDLALSFLLQVQCYDVSAGPALPDAPSSVYQSLIVPHESVADGRAMLGRAYVRSQTVFDGAPESMVMESHEDPSEDAAVAGLVHCVTDLDEGVHYEVQRNQENGLMVVMIAAGPRDGTLVMRSTFVDDQGNVLCVLDGKPICQFCDAMSPRSGTCSCPNSMRQRSTDWWQPVQATSWQSYMHLARRNMDGGLLMSSAHVGQLPPGMPDRHQVFLSFQGLAIDEARGRFVEHVASIKRTRDPGLNGFRISKAWVDFDGMDLSLDDISLGSFLDDGSVPISQPLLLQDESSSEELNAGTGRTRVVCPICLVIFAKYANLKRHVEAIHQRKREYSCGQCSAKFTQLGNLRRHETAVHAKIKAFSCSLCSLSFGSNANLQRHFRTQRHLRASGAVAAEGDVSAAG